MKKTPIKQIYLLLIIIVGIVSLSVYSTYALFTYEKETGDIVNISTLSYLSVDSNILEYKRIKVEANSLTKISINVNNSLSNNTCYGIWYDSLGNDNVFAYKKDNNSMTTGTLDSLSSLSVPIIILNTSDDNAYVNVGVNSSDGNECNLNLDINRKIITEIYEPIHINDYILNNISEEETEKDSEYREIKNYLINRNMDSLIVSTSFEFTDGIFTLKEPEDIPIDNLLEDETYYFLLNNNNHEMYRIDSMTKEIINTTRFIGFIKSTNGIIEYDNNLEYYGANPDNYICFDNKDNSCNLYRIIGLFYNKEENKYNLKIVKNDFLGEYQYSLTNNYLVDNDVNSSIYDMLKEYYDNLSDYAKNEIIEYEYKNDYNDSLEEDLINIYNYDSKNNYILNIGMLSLSDYLYASNCNTKKANEYDNDCYINNWLYKYNKEMLITRLDTNNDKIYAIKDGIYNEKYDSLLSMRPVMYLNSDIILIKGDGTINNPFIIR